MRMENLKVTSESFENNGLIPKKHTGFGEDISPQFNIENISDRAVSVAIIMNDLDIPFVKAYTHWVIWNIPIAKSIPENIKHGANVDNPKDAVQGIGWGKNRYRGPKQPPFIHKEHRYIFNFYILDTMLYIDSNSNKNKLIKAMDGHILQESSIVGVYKPR